MPKRLAGVGGAVGIHHDRVVGVQLGNVNTKVVHVESVRIPHHTFVAGSQSGTPLMENTKRVAVLVQLAGGYQRFPVRRCVLNPLVGGEDGVGDHEAE